MYEKVQFEALYSTQNIAFMKSKDRDYIKSFCDKHVIGAYEIDGDGKVSVTGSVSINSELDISSIPVHFKMVSGDFICSNNGMTTLKGCPTYVSGTFNCSFNYLTSLAGCPKYIGNNFMCAYNHLNSFIGLEDTFIGGELHLYDNADITDPSDLINFEILDKHPNASTFIDDDLRARYLIHLRIKNRIETINNILK